MKAVGSAEVGVVIVAAGSGTRLGRDVPKAFVAVAGRSILERSIRTALTITERCEVVVVAPADWLDATAEIVSRAAGGTPESVTVVPGGATRTQSVAAGLAALGPAVTVVLVHDAARAFTPVAQFESVISAVRTTAAGVVPGVPVTDTIKTVTTKTADAAATVLGTVDRSQLIAVQTPQGFPRRELDEAYARLAGPVSAEQPAPVEEPVPTEQSATAEQPVSDEEPEPTEQPAPVEYTDDAALFAAAGFTVSSIAGDPLAFKITTPWDLRRAELLVEEHSSAAPRVRTGVGVDVHAFDEASPLWLGGLFFDGEAGLAGHSDGDAVSHAMCDALLSAAGLGDIGGTFGTDDPRFENARGDVFLTATLELLANSGFSVSNVAVQIIAKKPKLAPRRVEMEQRLSALIGAPVSISATTTDGLGFTGRGDGVCAIATALVAYSPGFAAPIASAPVVAPPES